MIEGGETLNRKQARNQMVVEPIVNTTVLGVVSPTIQVVYF